MAEKKTGLVLEGGAMRGMYTAGVLDVFMEHGISFDGVIGVSAGAITGCSYISGQRGRTIRYNLNYCRDKRFMSFYSFLTTGDLVGADFCYRELPTNLDPYDNEAFKRSSMEFFVTCTNVETGDPEYIKMNDMVADMDYMRASASMPYVSRIVEKDGRKLLDGGVSDSVPVKKFMEMGYTKNVVVLTRPADYRKKVRKGSMANMFYRNYPKFAKTLKKRAESYNRMVEEIQLLEKEGQIFVICPELPLKIGRMSHNPKEIMEAYERGKADGSAKLQQMTDWLRS